MKVGLIGATGYAGMELVKLLHAHPNFDLHAIGSRSYDNTPLSTLNGFTYADAYTLISLEAFEAQLSDLELVFLSLPHGTSMHWVKKLYDMKIPVIDLSGDFRLDSKDEYEAWYNVEHIAPELLEIAEYGLADQISVTSQIVANPGCYPTASLTALLPLAQKGLLIDKTVVIDAKSGMTGAGKKMNEAILYCETNESMRPYGTGTHRHTPEIELVTEKAGAKNLKILFSPSVVPMDRGILASIYVPMDGSVSYESVLEIYKEAYADKPFVRILDKMPQTRWVKDTNYCDLHVVLDERTKTLIIHSAIDNLQKGAAGQAIQNANILFGLDEKTGL
jgi:N-acetyl-gamma-glutamyl-phosphate reductase